MVSRGDWVVVDSSVGFVRLEVVDEKMWIHKVRVRGDLQDGRWFHADVLLDRWVSFGPKPRGAQVDELVIRAGGGECVFKRVGGVLEEV